MAENMQGKTSFVRSRRGIALVVFLCLVVFDLVMMSVSFARYVTQSNQNASATVGGFTPVLHCGESWELEESFRITGNEGTTSLPFTVNNATSTTPVTVLVTLTVEDILPLSFELYAGSTLLSPTSESGNVRIYEYSMGCVNTEFSLQVAWQPDVEYDELYNGLTNDIDLVVTCEQAQVGGEP